MAYKTYTEEEIKAKGFELLQESVRFGGELAYQMAFNKGIVRAIEGFLEDYEEPKV